MSKKRVKPEDQCWACDGKGKVFDTSRHKKVMCLECVGKGIDPEKAYLYEEDVSDAD